VSAHAAGDAKHGKVLAQGCVGCHGVEYYDNVYPTYHVPKLGGQSADYIVSALGEYKSGARKHESMQGNAESLSDQDMADIAAYFSSLTPSKAE
jgi:cytochrome c553